MKTIKILISAALAAMLAFAFAGCSQDAGDSPAPHEHAFAAEWTSNETHHWHAATCGHDEKKDFDVHSAAAELGKNATGHWNVCDVCNASLETTSHTWDHEDFQYDVASGKEIKTCTVCGFVADKNHAHTEDGGTVTTAPTCVTKGVKTYKCSVCKVVLRTEKMSELYSSPIDAETGLAATKSSKYIYFGVFPKTVAAKTITVDENVSVTMGANTYYKGKNDENYYVKVKENAYGTGTEYKYFDTTQAKQSSSNSYRWFKVEPIKWKVITGSYSGKCLLLAEDILTANVPYYVSDLERTIAGKTVYAHNYKYSTIRAYLNGKYESDDTQSKTAYENKGFLQTAFTAEAQNLIAVTTVDNSAASTTDSGNKVAKAIDYACEDTKDKIFLLSLKEVTSYGFPAYNEYGQGNARIRKPTDYAMANHAYQSSTDDYGGDWWLRSPYRYLSDGARSVNYVGNADSYNDVINTLGGVVPALSISLQ